MKRILFAVALLLPSIAMADASEEADKKFDEGMKQMDAGHYDVACPLLADSYRLEPLAGALFTLAECETKWGRLASSLAHYESYVDLWEKMTSAQKTKQGSREKVARAQIASLKKDVPEITFELPANAAADVVVKRDNVAMSGDLGKPVRIDPGEHIIVVETVTGKTKESKIKVAIGEKRKLVLSIPDEPQTPTQAPVKEEPIRPKSTGGSHLPLTIAAGALGIAGVAVGAITGGIALGDKSTADAHCMGTMCDAEGLNAVDSGRTMGIVSTIGFIAGGVGIAAAVILFVTEPKKQTTGWRLGPGGALLVF